MKTKEEILMNCDNKNDRDLLIKLFKKIEKRASKINKIMGVATIFTLIGIIGIQFNAYFIFFLMPTFPLMFWAVILNLKGAGLV